MGRCDQRIRFYVVVRLAKEIGRKEYEEGEKIDESWLNVLGSANDKVYFYEPKENLVGKDF